MTEEKGAPIRTLSSKFKRNPQRQRHGGYTRQTGLGWLNNGSRNLSGDPTCDLMQDRINKNAAVVRLNLTPVSDLDLMIANGWGDTPQDRMPADWRTRKRRKPNA
jgi:hypothetical protein